MIKLIHGFYNMDRLELNSLFQQYPPALQLFPGYRVDDGLVWNLVHDRHRVPMKAVRVFYESLGEEYV